MNPASQGLALARSRHAGSGGDESSHRKVIF